MKHMYFYFHAGSGNHGCEAIVRSTVSLFRDRPVLISSCADEDKHYNIDRITDLKQKRRGESTFLEKIGCAFTSRVLHSEEYGYEVRAKHEALDYESGSVALSIGGDNYCYGEAYNYYLAGLNKQLHKRSVKTVLWGCSIEPDQITTKMKKDFSKYDLIVARESNSFELLKLYNTNTILSADPAFTLSKEELPLPINFQTGNTIGINISPLIQKNETIEGITIQNYRNMISYILSKTSYSIALIPHVVCEGNDDRIPLKMLLDYFGENDRICLIEDCNCMQLKGYISRCTMFIGARTHATIAAYSTGVPTLVIGYSNKAIGIAKDLFGTDKNYVLPVQNLKKETDMTYAFCWLDQNQDQIKAHLETFLPKYVKSLDLATERVREL